MSDEITKPEEVAADEQITDLPATPAAGEERVRGGGSSIYIDWGDIKGETTQTGFTGWISTVQR
jgi:hypothetical protein